MVTSSGTEIIENSTGQFWVEDGLLRFTAKQDSEQSRADAEESMRIFAELAGGKPRPVLMDITGVKKLSREARAIYTAETARRVFAAVAIVARSSITRALFNFIMAVSKPPYPSRMFDNMDEAQAWARARLSAD